MCFTLYTVSVIISPTVFYRVDKDMVSIVLFKVVMDCCRRVYVIICVLHMVMCSDTKLCRLSPTY